MIKKNRLQAIQLTCQRGDHLLFEQVSFEISSGEFIQLEGSNGIGKTSLIRILTGLSQPVQGNVFWNDSPIHKQKEHYYHDLLYIGHLTGVKRELTPWENLRFFQKTTQSFSAEESLWQALEQVGLIGYEDILTCKLSAGQQRRIALARLWLSQAPLWILDEPFTAIDKQGVKKLTSLFEQHTQQGGMVILTSHQPVNVSFPLKTISLNQYRARELT